MFGMGGSEIIVILIVALLFLGPDKLPEAAKTISKGIRDIKKQSRVLQRTIEDDEHIGGAIRDLKSALRGEDEPYRPPAKPKKELTESPDAAAADSASAGAVFEPPSEHKAIEAAAEPHIPPQEELAAFEGAPETAAAPARLTMPPTAGQADDDAPASSASQDAELAALVKPAPNTIAHTPRVPDADADEPGRKHG